MDIICSNASSPQGPHLFQKAQDSWRYFGKAESGSRCLCVAFLWIAFVSCYILALGTKSEREKVSEASSD
jgi:hypothetical protein